MSVLFAASGMHSHQKAQLRNWGFIALLFVGIGIFPFASYAEDIQSTGSEITQSSSLAAENQVPAKAQVSSVAAITPFYEKSASSTATSGTPNLGSGGHLLNVTLGLLLIVGLIFALSFFVKRFGTGSFAGNGQLKILSSMPLGTRERIVLVDAAGQQLLLGITPTSINTLHVFSEPVVVTNSSAAPMDFSQTLMTLLQPKKAARNTSDTAHTMNDKASDNNNPAA